MGVVWYFRFLQYIWGINVFLTILGSFARSFVCSTFNFDLMNCPGLISFVPHWISYRGDVAKPSFPEMFYVSTYK